MLIKGTAAIAKKRLLGVQSRAIRAPVTNGLKIDPSRPKLSAQPTPVARKGVGSLYYGVAPRLLQQVPSAMFGWWAVHAVARSLEPWTRR